MWRCLNLQLLEYHLGTPLLCYNNYPAELMPCDLEVVGLNSSHLFYIWLLYFTSGVSLIRSLKEVHL